MPRPALISARVHAVEFAGTIALVQRTGVRLSPVTRELARLARRVLLER